jgi:glycosyltransferase involved in cell wall biosynthesis
MRLLFVADGRSPIALNWISHFIKTGHEVHLLSTFHCQPDLEFASLKICPVAFSSFARFSTRSSGRAPGGAKGIGFRATMRHWLGLFTIPWAAERVRKAVIKIEPDLVHALRIPYEGIMTAAASPRPPLIISVWGNDFTLHAPSTPAMDVLTRRTLAHTDALHVDCKRDLRLAYEWGMSRRRPTLVVPAAGGVRREVFHPGETDMAELSDRIADVLQSLPPEAPVVVNPRGFRAYVRNDAFFQAIPAILVDHPAAIFLCPAMEGESQAVEWVDQLGISASVRLLPRLSPTDMAAVYRRAQVTVSPSEHDGTPNTLLEAMACGCFPVAGDLESIREWIEDDLNGLLIDPADSTELAGAVIRALSDETLRAKGVEHNHRLVAEKATHVEVMARVEAFYSQVRGRMTA